jgi:hypothetical protein
MKGGTMENPRLIVMPFVPDTGRVFDGTGLGIHFLFGNLFGVHPGLTECWFGWRVKKIFSDPAAFTAYCRGNTRQPDIQALGRQENVRYWLTGSFDGQGKTLQVSMVLHDINGADYKAILPMSLDDGLLDFRHRFLNWLETAGLAFPQTDAALWPEYITARGLDYLGCGLESLYVNYIQNVGSNEEPIDLFLFEKAVEASPDSYLAHDVKGWVLYKNQAVTAASSSFDTALALNKKGVGALSGMLWCAVNEKNRENALEYALAKAQITGTDPVKARAWVDKKLPG